MNKRIFIILSSLTLLLAISLSGSASAAYVGYPTADTFAYLGDTSYTPGLEANIMMDASNLAGCVASSHVWLLYQVPGSISASSDIMLQLHWVDIDLGPYAMPVELLSSSNTTWDEAALNWGNQPALDPVVLARAPDAPNGGTVSLRSPALTQYILDHAGQTISLVARADCSTPSAVDMNPVRMMRAREYGESGAVLTIAAPTAVGLHGLSGQTSGAFWPILSALVAASAILVLLRRKISNG
jgi:hypothetical protein